MPAAPSAWGSRGRCISPTSRVTRRRGGTLPRLRALQPRRARARGRGGEPVPRLARGLGRRGGRRRRAVAPSPPRRARAISDRPHAVAGEAARAPGRPRALSRKSAEPGERLLLLLADPDAGRAATVRAGGPRVHGRRRSRWMDREWSTSSLGTGSGRLGLVRAPARRRHASSCSTACASATAAVSPESQGTLVAVDGTTRVIGRDCGRGAGAGPLGEPAGRHPVSRRAGDSASPTEDLDVTVTPLLPDQELDLAVRYWEGAVRVEGTARGAPLRGTGYVELVGYARAAGETTEAVRQ